MPWASKIARCRTEIAAWSRNAPRFWDKAPEAQMGRGSSRAPPVKSTKLLITGRAPSQPQRTTLEAIELSARALPQTGIRADRADRVSSGDFFFIERSIFLLRSELNIAYAQFYSYLVVEV